MVTETETLADAEPLPLAQDEACTAALKCALVLDAAVAEPELDDRAPPDADPDSSALLDAVTDTGALGVAAAEASGLALTLALALEDADEDADEDAEDVALLAARRVAALAAVREALAEPLQLPDADAVGLDEAGKLSEAVAEADEADEADALGVAATLRGALALALPDDDAVPAPEASADAPALVVAAPVAEAAPEPEAHADAPALALALPNAEAPAEVLALGEAAATVANVEAVAAEEAEAVPDDVGSMEGTVGAAEREAECVGAAKATPVRLKSTLAFVRVCGAAHADSATSSQSTPAGPSSVEAEQPKAVLAAPHCSTAAQRTPLAWSLHVEVCREMCEAPPAVTHQPAPATLRDRT